ncbi:MAG: CocE/NonD family hydrolase [Acidobacteriota bacterium]|nr:CocE/NonD family hydrolase [Acidobacteriota bacterium]
MIRVRRVVTVLGILLVMLSVAQLSAQSQGHNEAEQKAEALKDYIRANYTKSEYLAPMRDGVRLFISVYAPKDTSKRYPIWMMRTPYTVGPYGADNYRDNLGPSELFARDGYIFAYCDVRGLGKSEGEFVHVRPYIPNKTGRQVDEASDAYDTIDFLLKTVPHNNGRVGVWGISYPGFYATMTILSGHPALKAASPQAPVTEWFLGDDWRHNGALFLAHAFNFLSAFGRPKTGENEVPGPGFDFGTPDGYDFYLRMGTLANADKEYFKGKIDYWQELISHDTYSSYWKSRNPLPYLKDVHAAVMTVGGWFDAEDAYGAMHTAQAMREQNPGAVSVQVEGPWFHGQWNRDAGEVLGDVHFNQKTGEYFREHIEFPFFQRFLKDQGEAKLPGAYVFETGRNEWHTLDRWPPPNATPTTYYFESGGRLSSAPPSASGEAFDEYVSDPAKPVPHISWISTSMSGPYMTGDQRFAGRRPDVLVYQTEPLTQDVTFAGPLKASLYVSTSGTDSDFIVKLIDVYPGNYPDPDPNPTGAKMGGYQQLVRGEPFRGKFRKSFEHPVPFAPGQPDKVEFQLPDIYQTFRPGHRIMVQVQSSWFPLVDRNPQKFMKIDEAQPSDFQKATERVYHSAKLPSSITVRVLPAGGASN